MTITSRRVVSTGYIDREPRPRCCYPHYDQGAGEQDRRDTVAGRPPPKPALSEGSRAQVVRSCYQHGSRLGPCGEYLRRAANQPSGTCASEVQCGRVSASCWSCLTDAAPPLPTGGLLCWQVAGAQLMELRSSPDALAIAKYVLGKQQQQQRGPARRCAARPCLTCPPSLPPSLLPLSWRQSTLASPPPSSTPPPCCSTCCSSGTPRSPRTSGGSGAPT